MMITSLANLRFGRGGDKVKWFSKEAFSKKAIDKSVDFIYKLLQNGIFIGLVTIVIELVCIYRPIHSYIESNNQALMQKEIEAIYTARQKANPNIQISKPTNKEVKDSLIYKANHTSSKDDRYVEEILLRYTIMHAVLLLLLGILNDRYTNKRRHDFLKNSLFEQPSILIGTVYAYKAKPLDPSTFNSYLTELYKENQAKVIEFNGSLYVAESEEASASKGISPEFTHQYSQATLEVAKNRQNNDTHGGGSA